MNPLIALAAVVLLIIYLYRYAVYRPDNFPPGPPRVPFFGSYIQLLLGNYWYPYRIIDRLTYTYKSKVLGLYLGPFPTVVACDQDSVREVLARPEFQGRFHNIVTSTRALEKFIGIFFVDGPLWHEQRRFALRHLRDFGFGRRSPHLEDETRAELEHLVAVLRGDVADDREVRREGGLALVPDVFYPAFINAILVPLAGARLPRERDGDLRHLGRVVMLFQKAFDTTGGFLGQMPALRHFFARATGHADNAFSAAFQQKFFRTVVGEHKTSFSDDHMRDFCDVYLSELRKRGDGQGLLDPSFFNDDQQIITMVDFFFPAATAISTTLVFGLVFMMHCPDVERKVQEEIDRVVGRSRLPHLDDRQNLPYTEATLRETMRRATLTPISIPHRCTEDTTFRGYNVAKNTMMITCLYSMHMDKDFWGDPEVFRPERFLDADGNLNKKDYTLPFGAGKRLCAGETYARQTLFLVFAALMQNFCFRMPPGEALLSMDDHIPGIIESKKPFWARVVARE